MKARIQRNISDNYFLRKLSFLYQTIWCYSHLNYSKIFFFNQKSVFFPLRTLLTPLIPLKYAVFLLHHTNKILLSSEAQVWKISVRKLKELEWKSLSKLKCRYHLSSGFDSILLTMSEYTLPLQWN